MMLAPRGVGHYWKAHYLDHTFIGLYRYNVWDAAMLVPYFIVMVILAFYGLHRYQLVWLYYRNRKNAAKWAEPAERFAEGELPFVTIQLPIYNEQFVIHRLIEACCRIDYPRGPLRDPGPRRLDRRDHRGCPADRRTLRRRLQRHAPAAHRLSPPREPLRL